MNLCFYETKSLRELFFAEQSGVKTKSDRPTCFFTSPDDRLRKEIILLF